MIPVLSLHLGCVRDSNIQERALHEVAPATWSSTTSPGNQSSERNQTFWLEHFPDPALSQAIRKAWISNPSLLAMAERVLASGEDVIVAGASLYPTAKADLSGSRSKRNLIGFNFPNGETSFTSKSFNAGINLSWEVDLWGKLRDRRNSAKILCKSQSLSKAKFRKIYETFTHAIAPGI